MAAAGAGGAHRSITVGPLTSSLPVRFVATAVAGGALAAIGQHALLQSLPASDADSNVLRLGVQQFLGSQQLADPQPDVGPATATVAPSSVIEPLVALAPVVAEPATKETAVFDAAELVKATDIQRQLTEAGTRAAAEQARAAEAERAAAKAAAAEAASKAEKAEKATDAAAAGAKVDAGKAAGKVDTSSLGGGAVQMVTGRVTSGFGGPLGHPARGTGHRRPDRHPDPGPAGWIGDRLRAGQRLRAVGPGPARRRHRHHLRPHQSVPREQGPAGRGRSEDR